MANLHGNLIQLIHIEPPVWVIFLSKPKYNTRSLSYVYKLQIVHIVNVPKNAYRSKIILGR